MLRQPLLSITLAIGAIATAHAQSKIYFWNPSGVTNSDLPSWGGAQVQIPDNMGNGGTIGVSYTKGNPAVTPSGATPGNNWDWQSGLSEGSLVAPSGVGATIGTYQQEGVVAMADGASPSTLGLQQACQNAYSCPALEGSQCSALYYTIEFDFTKTWLGLASFFPGIANVGGGNTTFQLRAVTLDGSPADFSGWKLYLADAVDNGFGSTWGWMLSPSGFIKGIADPKPPNWFDGENAVLGLMKLPSQRYTKIYFDVVSTQQVNPDQDNNCDYFEWFVAGGRIPGCTSNNIAYGTSSPSGKVAPFKPFTYSATLVNSRMATPARELTSGVKSQSAVGTPFLKTTFSMQLPAGVEVKGWSSTPKVATKPTVTGSQVTWDLGTTVGPGKKIRVNLKLVAADCTTPDALELYGTFGYTDNKGAQTADACLKKPLYVWTKTCDPIPISPKSSFGGAWGACTCPLCQRKGKSYMCPSDCCAPIV